MLSPRRTLPGLFVSLVPLLTFLWVLFVPYARSQPVASSTNIGWNPGAPDCSKSAEAPLQVHAYDARTFILRESLCSTWEAPFMYLLAGSARALLIDTGDVADPAKMPLAKTVADLIAASGANVPLLVVHTHRHLDHRSGDSQFSHMADTQVVGFDLDSVRRFYGFEDWPNGSAQIDLGNRIVDVIPTPGHNETEVSFYDRNTGLFFSGDFLMPGRLMINDAKADLASAERVAAFVQTRPVSFVLGGHIEENDKGQMFDWQSTYHPREHALELSNADLLALPVAIRRFNGFYTHTGNFVLMNSIRILVVSACGIGILLIALVLAVIRYVRRWRKRGDRCT